MANFSPRCLPLLIGSLPHDDHQLATELIFDHTPLIPIWPQLPVHDSEGMIPQFLGGFPGVAECEGKSYIDTEAADFDEQFLAYFEEYLMVTEGGAALDQSRFALSRDDAKGFFTFMEMAKAQQDTLVGLKGQITGPITFCTGVVDQAGRAIFYNEQLRDAAVKMLALKARWQARQMAQVSENTLVFLDEPGLSGFGSSAFITISANDITACLAETMAGIRAENCLAGVHVCANTEWSLLFDAGVDVVSYDAYSYFDKLLLYPEHLREFFTRGGILATGIVPTTADLIEAASVEEIVATWQKQTEELVGLGISREQVYSQSFITPSCGTGTVTREQAQKVMELTRDVSTRIRAELLSPNT